MSKYIVYREDSKEIQRVVQCPSSIIHLQLQGGESCIEGAITDETHVVNGIPEYRAPIAPVKSLVDKKTEKIREIKDAFNMAFYQGYQPSCVSFKVDCRRDDLDNIGRLIERWGDSVPETYEFQFKAFDNNVYTCTIAQLRALKVELIDYGFQLYNRKWQREYEIEVATDETIDSVTW